MRLPIVFGCFAAAVTLTAQADYAGVGRDATPAEVAAWDIDVRPDFLGLPPGSGSVEDGEELWIEKCSSCHGDFGDANHVFPPLIGNTTTEDIETGHVASLKKGGAVRTTIAKVSTVSTLWDFINRAMPWNAPKSLSTDQVYAILAYLLNLAEIVPNDYVLSNENIAEVQQRMPNRNGMTRDHGMWTIDGKPDTHNTACMKNCKKEATILSSLPDYARGANGDLSKQNREYGPVRGVPTPEPGAAAPAAAATDDKTPGPPTAILAANGCTGCHGMDQKVVGPAFSHVAEKYHGQADIVSRLSGRIRNGGSGSWGSIPMPPQPQLTDAEIQTIVEWLAAGAKH
ncbi:c-type cytochrome [Sinimarinibacterium sp. CAU 1509]|uniref:c-type cytochrome n=1 Tax=Sinimarinibacterium sp. CAU 1509 TaxID=2562283 RepID=UPI0010AC6135|nr:c-type cytochrome [Sinimarinibacterium sp. CAU 1509]TJY64838.1 c-type cytochrome [Sinimarinibacterium sp. CAU 1509]